MFPTNFILLVIISITMIIIMCNNCKYMILQILQRIIMICHILIYLILLYSVSFIHSLNMYALNISYTGAIFWQQGHSMKADNTKMSKCIPLDGDHMYKHIKCKGACGIWIINLCREWLNQNSSI